MNSTFLDEAWAHVTTSLYAIEYWATYEYRGEGDSIEVWEGIKRDGKKSYFLNRYDLEEDLRKLYDLATVRVFADNNYVQDWANNFVAGIATQDIAEWDNEVVDVFVQLSTLGEITYG